MLVLIAHGSRSREWRQSLETLTATVLQGDPAQEIRLAYMQFSGPTLEEVVKEATDRGIREIRVLPLFMASAGHVDKDIRPMVEALGRRFTHAELHLLPPVGEHPLFRELIQTIAHAPPRGDEM